MCPRRLCIWLCAFFCVTSAGRLAEAQNAPGKDWEKADERIRSIVAVSLEGKYLSSSLQCNAMHFERLGSKIFYSGDVYSILHGRDWKASKSRLDKIKELLGDSRPAWGLFTGETLVRYDPFNLTLNIRTEPQFHALNHVHPFDPSNWNQPLIPTVELRLLMSSATYEGSSSGIHTFRRAKMESDANKDKLGYTDLVLRFDENQGWNWVECECDGGLFGYIHQSRTWKAQDEFWYPVKGTMKRGEQGVDFEEWEIQDIHFGPEHVTATFDWEENKLPVGIEVIEGPPGAVTRRHYVGGEDGERQFRLIKAAQRLSTSSGG